MVSTRAGVKILVKEYVEQQRDPFTIQQVKERVDSETTNVYTSPQMLAKYVQATGLAESKNKFWVPVRVKPKINGKI